MTDSLVPAARSMYRTKRETLLSAFRLSQSRSAIRTWRRLWIALATAERELGLDISQEQIDELTAHAEDINYAEAEAREKLVTGSPWKEGRGLPSPW